jgi:hypothetical protein
VFGLALSALAACGGRSVSLPEDAGGDAQADGAAQPCAPMAAHSGPSCDEPGIVGYTWTGTACEPVWCECLGEDCGALHGTQAECYAALPAECVEGDECEAQDYPTCQDRQDCQLLWYGGACLNLEDCSNTIPEDGDWICWEQGFRCVPSDHPCNQRGPGDCDGECYWREGRQELCIEGCCVEESWGYCAALPVAPDCDAQEISGCPDPCGSVVGWSWDGDFCQPIICCCEGPDCADTWDTLEGCRAARFECTANACARTGGYCDYSDYTQPVCLEGYFGDSALTTANPGVCGLGICCAPCPDPEDPAVHYAGSSPLECADIDFACNATQRFFDNECGCGCIDL